MKSIAFFNNKGGVGKTTLLCNIAAYLNISLNKKVLVVDADPQCNATSYLLDDEIFIDILSDNHKKVSKINDLILPVQNGEGYLQRFFPIKSPFFNVALLPGTPKFAQAEDFLSRDWVDVKASAIRGIKTNMVFMHLLKQCSDYDYVLFDMGPSLGAINRAVLLGCDYFITPMSSDIFSLLALDNIGSSLSKWKEEFNTSLSKLCPEDKQYLKDYPSGCHIKFLGYVTQQYVSKNIDGEKRPVRAYDKILSEIPDTIQKKIVNTLNDGNNSINYDIGSIPNFFSLIPMSQTAHKPIFELGSADGVLGAHYKKVNDYEVLIQSIATRILENMETMR